MPTGPPGSGGGSRMSNMLAQAQSKAAFDDGESGWEPPPPPDEVLAEQEARAEAAREEARQDGFDPDDEDSMKAWRRSLAEKAKQRQMSARSIAPRAPIVREEEPAPPEPEELVAMRAREAGREPEKYVPFDEEPGAEVDNVWGNGDAMAMKQNVRAEPPPLF